MLTTIIIASQISQVSQPTISQAELTKMFNGAAKVSFEGDSMVITSNGIPNHTTAQYPNASNPNSIREQNLRFYIPLKPRRAASPSPTPFGPIGVALNGIPFYNQYTREGNDAVRTEVFDSCCGHPDQRGLYHYHKFPVCVRSPFKEEAGKHSPLVGFMFDGYAIYGPNGEHGKPPTDLDDCNGHTDSVRGYHYHATEAYPYLVGAYRGTPDFRNFPRRR